MGVSWDENLGARPVIFVIWGGLLLAGWSSRFAVSVSNVPHRPKGGGAAGGIQPVATTKIRAEHGWAAWPVYLMWVALACGIATSIVGFFLYFGTSPKHGR